MAGGRRPASYVSGARHNTGVERQQPPHERPVSPTAPSANVPSLPLWIPSIWQPAPGKAPMPEETTTSALLRERPPPHGDPSSALAAALDSAVQSAVVRALGTSGPIPPASPQVTSTVSSDTGLEDDSALPRLTARERELGELVESLRTRLSQRDDDVRLLTERLDSVEKRVADVEASKRRQERLIADTSSQMKKFSDSAAESERKQDARLASLREQFRASQNAVSKLRASQKNSDADVGAMSRRTRELTDEVHHMRNTLSSQLEKAWSRLEQLDHSLKSALRSLDDRTVDDGAPHEAEIADLRRTVESSVETVAAMRSRLRKVESQIGEVSKQTNESIALTSGFEDSIRAGVEEIRESVAALHATVGQMQGSVPESTSRERDDDLSGGRMDSLEANLKGLKKLIESNLRTQWSAESIVKEQVSLITKHVCVAMRQYTARRISENNALIDQALRARIPEYAKNDDQFVLVREEDLEGNESVDIQRTSEVTMSNGFEILALEGNEEPSFALGRIEQLAFSFVADVVSGHVDGGVHMVKRSSRNATDDDVTGAVLLGLGTSCRRLDLRSASAMSRLLQVMSAIQKLLLSGKRISQRELFYLLREAFDNQQQVNETILDVSATLGVPRYALNIGAATRGVVAGCLCVATVGSLSHVNCEHVGMNGWPIPGDVLEARSVVFTSTARYIIVVEKFGIFSRLVQDRVFERLPCVLVCGKGYPSISTRVMTSLLSTRLRAPVLGIADFNPHGLALLQCYRRGSVRSSMEGSRFVCDVRWLGLRASQIRKHSCIGGSGEPLSSRDKAILRGLEQNNNLVRNDPRYRKEIDAMRQLGKYELQWLYGHEAGIDFLQTFVLDAVLHADYL